MTEIGLGQFELFNGAYYVVTKNLNLAVENNYFNNPKLVDELMVAFASYYFAAINDTNKGLSVASPWAKLNTYAEIKSPPRFLSLMLGANAHINYDLPQALNVFLKHQNSQDFVKDLVKFNKILMASGKEIIVLFDEPNKKLNFLKRNFQFMYFRPAMYTILYWRIMAWRNYKKLCKSQAWLGAITISSDRIANRLLLLANTI